MSTILFSCVALNPRTDDILGSTIPFMNGIYVVSPELLSKNEVPPYFGDTMTFATWKSIPIYIGEGSTDATHTLVAGYSYKYNVTRKTFVIKDDKNAVIYAVSNVKSVDDMSIDFTIIHSHQFEIVFDGDDNSTSFFISAKFSKPSYEGKGTDVKVSGIKDNKFTPMLNFIGGYEDYLFYFDDYFLRVEEDAYTGIGKYDINFDNIYRDGLFYNKPFSVLSAIYSKKLYRANMLTMSHYLFALISLSLCPIKQPILQYGETSNNRPVYEPWLIWGFYKFLVNKYTWDDEDDYLIDVFDLSPSYESING